MPWSYVYGFNIGTRSYWAIAPYDGFDQDRDAMSRSVSALWEILADAWRASPNDFPCVSASDEMLVATPIASLIVVTYNKVTWHHRSVQTFSSILKSQKNAFLLMHALGE